jgi:hypothetical protein
MAYYREGCLSAWPLSFPSLFQALYLWSFSIHVLFLQRPWPPRPVQLLKALLLFLLVWPLPLDTGSDAGPLIKWPQLNRVPPRPADAIGGREFARLTAELSGPDRQQAALAELRRGNVPQFLRRLKPVVLTHQTPAGDTLAAIIWVTPDYLAIGADEDFLRIPLAYPSATAIAGEFGCVLPTRKMVDAIYEQSALHLRPQPMQPGPRMRSSEYYLRHQQLIENQLNGRSRGELVSGHKKDVVLTNRLHRKPGRIAIYGWHQPNGEPIQPLSTVHGARYADYSHGIRLVSAEFWINGQAHSVYDALQDPELALLLTYEGVIERPLALMRRPR